MFAFFRFQSPARPLIRLSTVAAILLATALRLAAQGTHLWTQSQIDEFEKGTPQGVAILSDGHLREGPGLTELLTQFAGRYGDALPPVYITENGCSAVDEPTADGTLDDQPRIRYLDGHLRALADAITAGVDVRGYLAWSLMDNFEWSEGYDQRFGLVHVDFATQVRTPRASFSWYRNLIATQRIKPSV